MVLMVYLCTGLGVLILSWQVMAEEGATVKQGEPLMILEAMKMEVRCIMFSLFPYPN